MGRRDPGAEAGEGRGAFIAPISVEAFDSSTIVVTIFQVEAHRKAI